MAEIVYDNTKVFGSDIYNAPSRHGDEIELAGTAREITQFVFGYAGDLAVGASAQGTVRVYANDGPKYIFANGTKETPMPGSLLWQSNPIQLVTGNQIVTLTVPNIVVPDSFTWTMEFSGAIGLGSGLSITGPPTVGADLEGDRVGSYDDFWVQNDIGKPDSWVLRRFGFTSSDFYAQVTAVGGVAPIPPLVAALPVVQEGKVALNWTGGTAPFRVQFRPEIDAAWMNLLGTTNRSHTAAVTSADGFYQIVETVIVPTPPLVAGLPVIQDGLLTLNWTGGTAPFRVQFRPAIDAAWMNLLVTTHRSYSAAADKADGFYRVVETPVVPGPFISHAPLVQDGVLTLTWDGGYPPFRVQSKLTADGVWTDLGTTNERTYSAPAADADRFYRVVDAFN